MENLFNNVKPKSKELYISNIRRLRNGLQNLPLNDDTAIDIESLDFLQDVDKVLTYLTTKYAPTTVRSYFIAISSMLNELPKYKNLYNKYYKILMDQNKSLERNNSKSETQKENWISQDDVLEKQKEYEAKATEVINLFGEGSKKWRPKEWNVILDWVIISLYTLLPPRRLIDYSEMNVVNDTSLEVDEKMNYFVKSKKRFIFTNYKTAGTYNKQVTPVPDELDKILQTYLDLRKDKDTNDIPLLITATGEPIRENYTITKHLNKIFGKKVSVNMLRNIYLTTNFKDNLTNLKEVATLMGTSPETIQNHYVKLDEDFPATEPKNKGLTIRKPQRLEEATPSTEPTDKKIKINRGVSSPTSRPVGEPREEPKVTPGKYSAAIDTNAKLTRRGRKKQSLSKSPDVIPLRGVSSPTSRSGGEPREYTPEEKASIFNKQIGYRPKITGKYEFTVRPFDLTVTKTMEKSAKKEAEKEAENRRRYRGFIRPLPTETELDRMATEFDKAKIPIEKLYRAELDQFKTDVINGKNPTIELFEGKVTYPIPSIDADPKSFEVLRIQMFLELQNLATENGKLPKNTPYERAIAWELSQKNDYETFDKYRRYSNDLYNDTIVSYQHRFRKMYEKAYSQIYK